jgi:hypothetical protein
MPLLSNNNKKMEKPMGRSSELKEILSDSIKDRIHSLNTHERFNTEEENITKVTNQVEKFLNSYQSLSEEEFSDTIKGLNTQLDNIVKSFSPNYDYTFAFIKMNEIKSVNEFIKEFPMQFIPRKEDIGRILCTAQEMHNIRTGQGEKKESDPIRIVDIGGANGSLGKLIIDLAKENNIKIEYTVVDPNADEKKASNFYSDDSNLKFHQETAGNFNENFYADKPEIFNLIQERKEIVKEVTEKGEELNTLLQNIKGQKPKSLTTDLINKYINILKTDFNLDLPRKLSLQADEFLEIFEIDYDEFPSISYINKYIRTWKEKIELITNKLETKIAKENSHFDLTINSWMPVSTDFTKDVREINSAAIVYVLERYGATGCRSDARYEEYPTGIMEEESYTPGKNYKSQNAWLSYSTPQIYRMEKDMDMERIKDEEKKYYVLQDYQNPPFLNTFYLQTNTKYSQKSLNINPSAANINIGEPYPWEEELVRKGGDNSPIYPITNTDLEEGLYSKFDELAQGMEKIQNK